MSRKTTMLRQQVPLALATLALFLPGCGSYQERLAELSAPELGCAQAEIAIADVFTTKSAARYAATCADGRVYRCISMGKPFGDEPETTCQLNTEASPDVPSDESDVVGSTSQARNRTVTRGLLPGGWPRVRIAQCDTELT